jgi:hypothetical protein
VFDKTNPNAPCDYCSTRGLECGYKLPTPRKLAEGGCFSMMSGLQLPMAIAQPLSSAHLAGQLNIQIPVAVSHFNLSGSGHSADREMSFTFQSTNASPTSPGYKPYSSAAGFASMMSPVSLGFAVPQSDFPIVRTWSQDETSTPPYSSSTEPSPAPSTPVEFKNPGTSRPCPPPRHPGHTLTATILPFVNSAIPNMQGAPNTSPLTEEEMWEMCQQLYLQLDGRSPTPAETEFIPFPMRLRLNRLLRMPRNMVGRKLAGTWEDGEETNVKKDVESTKSIKSAPSILC